MQEHYDFHPLALDRLIPDSWGTRVEEFASHIFMVLFFPVYSKERKDTRPRELNIIATKTVLVTSHHNSLLPLKALFDECNLYKEKRKQLMQQGAGFLLYALLRELWEDCSIKMARIDKKLLHIEESVFEGREKAMLKEISFAKADIINFWRTVRPQKGTIESLCEICPRFFGENLAPYFSLLKTHWAKVTSNLMIFKETAGSLEETNESLLASKTNEIMKVLTMFSVVLLPLTLIAGIFSMDTRILPIAGTPGDFWMISGIMLTCVLFMLFYFKKKRWI